MPTAMHETIIGAVKTAIETLTGEPTVTIRTQMTRMDGDALPLIVLTMGDERDKEYTLGGTVFREYEVIATFLYAQNHVLTSGYADARGWRDDVRKRLIPDPTVSLPILAGATAVWDVDAVNLPAEDPRALNQGYELARLGLLYQTNEVSHA
jgi:hypothetical protein